MHNRTIELRTLGKSGIEVGTVGFGLWAAGGNFWGTTDDGEIMEAIDIAVEAGVNFFDTADVYGDGHSEELLGRSMQGRRHRFVVATKIGWEGFDDETKTSAYTTVEKLIRGVESNLERLRTDYIDIIQSHLDYRDPTMEVFVEGFQRLQKDGKVRAYGVSTSDFDYLKAFNSDERCATLQVDYSILNRTAEVEILPYCMDNDIGVIVRGALAMGMLTGKFDRETQFAENDFRRRWIESEEENRIFRDDLIKAEELKALCGNRTLAQLALQFTLAHPAVTTVIPGIKNPRQLRDNLEAATLPKLAKDDLELIDGIVPPGGGRKIWPA